MRSIDDIIDRLDSSSVDGGPDDAQSPAVSSSVQHAGDEDTLRAYTATDGGQRDAGSGGGVRLSDVKCLTATADDRRRTAEDVRVDRRRSASESALSPDTEPLWNMFGAPLSQLCRRLLTGAVQPEDLEQRRSAVAKSESAESRLTNVVRGETSTTQVSKNLRQSDEVQSAHGSVDVQPLRSSGVGVVRSNGRSSHTQDHKPPLPTKPSLPPKPPISKKPSFSKETSAGVVRKPSSLSSPPCSLSSSSTTQQRQTRSTSSRQSGGSCTDDGPPTTPNSAPTSPTVRVVQRDARQHQQVPAGSTAGRSSVVTAARPRSADRTNVDEKAKSATAGDAANARSPARDHRSPARDRMKTTKSEEFLAKINRRSVSPVGTPRIASRSTRGKSVDLSAPCDMSSSVGRRTLSKEWAVLTTTTQEEVTVVYRPPAASSAPDTVSVDAPVVTTRAVGEVSGQGTVNDNTVVDGGGRLYKTGIDNIRLGVSTTTKRPDSRDSDDVSCQRPVVRSPSSETGRGHGRESANGAYQLDDLISSLIEMSVDVEAAQPSNSSSQRHGVVSAAHY